MTGLLVAVAASAERSAAGVGTAGGDAAVHHGAWQVYRRMAVWAGRRALQAEAEYWKAVQA